MTLNKKDLTIEKALAHLYEQIPQSNDNDIVKEFLDSETVDLQQECTTLEEEKDELEVQIKGIRAELEEDTKMLLEEQSPPTNLYDQQKREISLRIEKNLTLEEMEAMEQIAKNSIRNYVLD